jgi:CO/xanthine dehydrogenase Mo-binding subunit
VNDSLDIARPARKYKVVGTRPIRPDGVPKVTGRAQYGADLVMPGMLYGRVLRSPHAHARILSIDTSKAQALKGVKAVVTAADFPEQKFAYVGPDRVAANFWHMTRNIMAREKALYEGHAVAAVAAISPAIAEEALGLIDVKYEVLPHVIDVDEAMKPDAPLLFEDMITRGIEPPPAKPSNIAKKTVFKHGDVAKGFAKADVIVEREFKTAAVHQAYIEPHACVARYEADGQAELWVSSQGHFTVRTLTAQLCGMRQSDLRVIPAEIGGGFGGKTVVYLEPTAMMLSKKAGLPVRLTMSRDEVFKASGPTSGASMRIKIGVTRDGLITAAEGEFRFQAGAFPGSPVLNAGMCAFSMYHVENAIATCYDVVSNRPKVAAYRAPGSPIAAFGTEQVMDLIAEQLGMDPIDLRLKNAARPGSPMLGGGPLQFHGFAETLKALKAHPAYGTKLGPNQGRGVACGFWFNGGGESGATIQVNADGTALVATGSPDIGGSRAAMAMMTAETLGIPYDQVRAIVADTGSVGYTHVTGGSRVTFATGMAVETANKAMIKELCLRAARIWNVDPEGVVWEDGFAKPAGANVGNFDPLSLKEIAAKAGATGGPLSTAGAVNPSNQAPGFSAQFVDLEVDRETGKVTILRFVAAQDAGTMIHPSYVEGQVQGGVAQGIGWALNEEYIYDRNGRLENAGFLDYRIPVASDPMPIEPLMVEVPNPHHAYGVKGVGEANIVPPLAAIANAVQKAVGVRMQSLPISPPRLLAAMDAKRG